MTFSSQTIAQAQTEYDTYMSHSVPDARQKPQELTEQMKSEDRLRVEKEWLQYNASEQTRLEANDAKNTAYTVFWSVAQDIHAVLSAE
jgi:hypothetical protein